jgi:hypothetical protein
MIKFWVNSNSGDYVSHDEKNGEWRLSLISRVIDNCYYSHESINITETQFKSLKGFVPIKEKKLFSSKRLGNYNVYNTYAPTKSDGTKGEGERTKVPTISEVRDIRLKELGL